MILRGFVLKKGKIPSIQGEGGLDFMSLFVKAYRCTKQNMLFPVAFYFTKAAEGRGRKYTAKVGGHFSLFNL